MSVAPAPPTADGRTAQALRTYLHEQGYAGPGLRALLGTGSGLVVNEASLPLVQARLDAEGGALAALTRLLLLGERLADAERELGMGAELLVRCGLATEADGALRRRALLVPHDDLLVATDDPKGGVGAEYVPDVARSSAILAARTVRRPVEAALDVGTGSGIQALLASRHAGRVVAVDVSERALAYASFNCALNGVENVELRQGSFFEPVEGERFGLVVSNPPFAISPETDLVFRDSGLGRDRVSELVVAGAAEALEAGGYASVNVSWIVAGEDAARPLEWIESTGHAGWLLHDEPLDAYASAVAWLGADAGDALERWRAYYEREGIERVGIGTLVLHAGGGSWGRAREVGSGATAGHHLERLFSGVELARGDLASVQLAPAPDLELALVHARSDSGWTVRHASLRLAGGLGIETTVDDAVVDLVRALDGRPLASLLATVPPAGREDVLRVVRGLLELGLLVAVEK